MEMASVIWMIWRVPPGGTKYNPTAIQVGIPWVPARLRFAISTFSFRFVSGPVPSVSRTTFRLDSDLLTYYYYY